MLSKNHPVCCHYMETKKWETMYRVCGFWPGTYFGVRPAAGNKFYLRLMSKKMHVFAVFTRKYLPPYGCSGINFTAEVNRVNPKTETQKINY